MCYRTDFYVLIYEVMPGSPLVLAPSRPLLGRGWNVRGKPAKSANVGMQSEVDGCSPGSREGLIQRDRQEYKCVILPEHVPLHGAAQTGSVLFISFPPQSFVASNQTAILTPCQARRS